MRDFLWRWFRAWVMPVAWRRLPSPWPGDDLWLDVDDAPDWRKVID